MRIDSKLRVALSVGLLGLCAVLGAAFALTHTMVAAAEPGVAGDDGSVTLPGLTIPESSLLSAETHDALRQAREIKSRERATKAPCPPLDRANPAEVPEIRKCEAEAFYTTPLYREMVNRYDVKITSMETAGVYSEVFVPTGGVTPENKERVLLNLHGGGFMYGSGVASRLESIPISSIGKIEVISVDYRMAPLYSFPSATEDVVIVYRELLKSYDPKSIGIFGCSAGGVLTAETLSWLQKEGLPLPGAAGMFCGAAGFWTEGDSGYMGPALAGTPSSVHRDLYLKYFKDSNPNDPLVFPIRSPRVLANFPPSLLITSTRDVALSSVVSTHAILVKQGVEAELHVFEGLGHAFFMDPTIPESRDVYDIVVKFFDKHLNKREEFGGVHAGVCDHLADWIDGGPGNASESCGSISYSNTNRIR